MPATEHPYVLVKSPLHIIGVYLATLRERFSSPGETFQWFYNEEDHLSRIYIEAGAGDELKKNDARPALYVDRAAIIFPQVTVGDFAGQQNHTGLKGYYCVGNGQILVDCVSSNRGESAVLGDIVQGFLLMSSNEILRVYNIRDNTPITLGPTTVWEKDNRLYSTRVTSEISFDVKWAERPVARKIQSLDTRITHSNNVDYHQLAFDSLARVDLGE